ncbi:benzoate 4-monooxygenase cytochrome P450, putative [Talaromyces stipitatus ATCC 10500]|nr:benzoate 4-monooxygenase cytochrome P450, putative [Talaromyces stipitatus ATCC 10500]EED17999.1 benzoate 4-monooxygenase cytochrome P450, putative [Talaromyces stipitatus ATCC 10500]
MKLKYPVASLFSLSNVSKFEVLVDEVLSVIDEQLDRRFASHGEIFDLTEWLQFFAFDVMGTMTFSKRYGFLEEGKDVGGMLNAIGQFMKQAAPVMQNPWLDRVLYKNRIADSLKRTPGSDIMKFVVAAINERQKSASEDEDFTKARKGKNDFLDEYIITQKKDSNIPPWFVTAWTISNVLAGSDSVGTVMKTTMYNLLTNPRTLEKLHAELVAANVSRPRPRWSEVHNLPYLDAVVQEALRVHPPFALPFERIVPEGGLHISGQYIPANTVIGASPYVVNRHKPTYGDDAELWRPERWLEGGPEVRKKRDDGLLTFGAGRRICLGKHIGIFEVKKLIPFLVLNYDISIVKPETFLAENEWFFRQSNLLAQIRRRPLESVEPNV